MACSFMKGRTLAGQGRFRRCPSGNPVARSYILRADRTWSDLWGWASMIYIIAFFVPPLGLLLNGQPFAALFNLLLIVPCLFFGLIFHVLLLVPSAHAIIAIYHEREQRKHREIVEAIREHGPPPGWRS
jgi:hypothetical protein